MIAFPLSIFVFSALLAPEPVVARPQTAVEAVAAKALAAVPGESAFVFTELTADGPRPLFGSRRDERFAVGSSFKLYILGTLIDDVNAGRRQFEEVIRLQAELRGPPHSELADWPVGSPVTLHTLALKMISISDNTATDHLHALLGRERIENQMRVMGHGKAEVNRPLLSTREMTMLRDKALDLPGRDYLRLDEAARRKFLEAKVRGVPDYDAIDFDASAYSLAEWYASPMDLARCLDWIYRHTTSDRPAHAAREVLAIDPKLKTDGTIWKFVGFKGGSEDRLLAGNWLMQHHSGRWYTFHVLCNSPEKDVPREAMLGAIQSILAAIEPTLAD